MEHWNEKIWKAIMKAGDRCVMDLFDFGTYSIYENIYRYKALRELPAEEIEQAYEVIADRIGRD